MLVIRKSRFLILGLLTATFGVSTNSVAYNPLSSGAPNRPSQKTLHACGILNSPGTLYVLGADVSAPATCFSIQANGITLDLNGHTISYGSGARKTAAFAILGIACWDTRLSNGVANGNPCGGNFDRLTIKNGKIIQTPGMAPFSDAIHLGQGGGNRPVIRDMEIRVNGDSAIPIYTTYSGRGAEVSGNTLWNDVTGIRNRHQLQGMSIKFEASQDLPPGQTIHDNRIEGGAQGGILLETFGAKAYGNKIRQNGRYSNDFGIYVWGSNQQIYQNEIKAISGRGIQIAGGAINAGGPGKGGSHSEIRENKVEVIEVKQNCDYSESNSVCNACELGGAYGIQFDDNPQGDLSAGNQVIARADECDASALRVTDSQLTENESQFESFTASRVRANSPGKAYGWDNSGPKGFTSRSDVFIGDSASYHASWDGAQNESCISCTFGKGAVNPSADYVTFSFQNGGNNPVRNVHFLDTKFIGGANKDSTDLRPLDSTNWPGYAEYFVDWTVTFSAFDQHGKPLPGADIAIRDDTGALVLQGKTNPQGQLVAILNEFRRFNTPSNVVKEMHTPHTVEIFKAGCSADLPKFSLQVTEPLSRSVSLSCSLK